MATHTTPAAAMLSAIGGEARSAASEGRMREGRQGIPGIGDTASMARTGELRQDAMESGPNAVLQNAEHPGSTLVAGVRASGDSRRDGDLGSGEATILRLSAPIERLPVEMTVAVPVRAFRVRDLLAMAPGALIETQWAPGEDLPLASGTVQLAWSEFEVVDTRLAVRVTRLG